MSFFYLIFFCIYYRNQQIFEFIRNITNKSCNNNEKTKFLMKMID